MTTSHQWAWAFGEAACVTAVRDRGPVSVLHEFGGDPEQPAVDFDVAFEHEAAIRLLGLPGWTLASEWNGLQGVRAEVLQAVSVGTTAVSAFWNLTSGPFVTVAHDGQVAARAELAFDDTVDVVGDDSDLRQWMLQLYDRIEAQHPALMSVAMLELLTGLTLDAGMSAQAGPMHLLVPWLDEYASTGAASDLRHDDADLLALLVAAPAKDRRRLGGWASQVAVQKAGLAADPLLGAPTSGEALNADTLTRLRQLVHESHEPYSWNDDERYRAGHEQRRRRAWAARSMYAARNPDDLTAAADAVRFAFHAAGADPAVLRQARVVLAASGD